MLLSGAGSQNRSGSHVKVGPAPQHCNMSKDEHLDYER